METNKATAAPVGTLTSKEFNYTFRTDNIRDDSGKVLGKGRKHPDVASVLPVPTAHDVIKFLQHGGKEAALIMDTLYAQVEVAGRQQINDWRENNGAEKDFTATLFDLSKLSIEAIAALEPKDRASTGPSEEDITAFLDDYMHVMLHVVGYEEKRVNMHIMHYKVQLRRIKNDKAAVQKLLDLLNTWASKTENLEDHLIVYEDLSKRAAKYLRAEEKDMANAL